MAVTGGSRGIGAAVVQRAAEAGYDVVVGWRRDQGAAVAVADRARSVGVTAEACSVDVTDPSSLSQFFAVAASLGPLTGVVASAGAVQSLGELTSLDPAAIERDLEVDLLGPVLTARAAIPHLPQARGSLVFIGSAAATIGSPGTYVHYAGRGGTRSRAFEGDR